jgi:hypothetical protein
MRRLLLLASTVVLVDTSFYAAITPLLPELTQQFGLTKTGASSSPYREHVRRRAAGMAARVGVADRAARSR